MSNTLKDEKRETNGDEEDEWESDLKDELGGAEFDKDVPTDLILENKRNHPAFSSMLRSKGSSALQPVRCSTANGAKQVGY